MIVDSVWRIDKTNDLWQRSPCPSGSSPRRNLPDSAAERRRGRCHCAHQRPSRGSNEPARVSSGEEHGPLLPAIRKPSNQPQQSLSSRNRIVVVTKRTRRPHGPLHYERRIPLEHVTAIVLSDGELEVGVADEVPREVERLEGGLMRLFIRGAAGQRLFQAKCSVLLEHFVVRRFAQLQAEVLVPKVPAPQFRVGRFK